MFGLLNDKFYEDPQRRAFMAFGTGLLSQGGANSRALAAGLDGAVQGGLDDRQRAQKAAELKQMQDMRAMQMKEMQSQMDAAASAQARDGRIAGRMQQPTTPGPQPQGMPQLSAAPQMSAPGGPPAIAPPQQQAPNPGQMVIENLTRLYKAQWAEGDVKGAADTLKRLQEANKVNSTQMFLGADGKPRMRSLNSAGQWSDASQDVVAKELHWMNNGTKNVGVNAYTGAPQASFDINQSPDSQATERTAKARTALGYANLDVERKKAAGGAGGGPDGMLPDDVAGMLADQAMAGDTSVFQNLGRGAQGAQNIIKIRKLIAEKSLASGQGGADLAAKNAEYFGTKAGQRSAGTRIANVEMAASEAQELIPLTRQASADVVRSGFLPFGKAQMFIDNKTNSPEMRKFVAANNSMVNVYARAISPTGQPTVSDKEHAREMLQTAYDHNSYNAVLDQMELEIGAARKAPKNVRQEFSDSVTGRHAAPAVRPPLAANVPQGAVAMLKANPNMRAQFEAKYGAGSAAQYLGK